MRFTLAGMMSNDIGVDLGTANTLIWVKGRGIVLNEPSIVAVDGTTHRPLAIGLEAKEMLGRAPGDIEVIRPMKDGVIANFEVAEEMLRGFLTKVQRNRGLFRPRVVICVPSGITTSRSRSLLGPMAPRAAEPNSTIRRGCAFSTTRRTTSRSTSSTAPSIWSISCGIPCSLRRGSCRNGLSSKAPVPPRTNTSPNIVPH